MGHLPLHCIRLEGKVNMRRANGTGSVADLGPGRRKRYAVRISYQERPGLWKQKYLSYHRTAKEAQAALDDYLKPGITTQELATTWGDIYEGWSARKYAKVGPASVGSYRASWGRLCVLASKPMINVTIDDLQAIIDEDERKGLSKSSINNDKILMKALFKYAMERDIVSKDYSAFVDLPTVGAKVEKGAFNDLQMAKLEQLAADGMPWADTALMLCYTGFRVSEFLGLTRFAYHTDGDYLQGGMKTAAGRGRIVPVHPKIKPYLMSWLARGGDTIICKADGSALRSETYRDYFAQVAAALGVPNATPHWCRHTAASRMRMAGMDELAVKRVLGHADKDITDHYTHVDVDYLRREILKVS